MEIEIADWAPDLFKQTKLLGKVKVLLNGKMFIWMNVVAGKTRPFAKFPTFKAREDEYLSYIGWPENPKMEREISDAIIKKLQETNEI